MGPSTLQSHAIHIFPSPNTSNHLLSLIKSSGRRLGVEFEKMLLDKSVPIEQGRRFQSLVRLCISANQLAKRIRNLLRLFQEHTKRVHLERESYIDLFPQLKVTAAVNGVPAPF